MLKEFKRIKEKLNLVAYDYQKKGSQWTRIVMLLASILSFGLIIYYYGYPHSPQKGELIVLAIKAVFGIYILNYFVRWVLSIHRWLFIKHNVFETILVFCVLIDGVSSYFLNYPILSKFFESLGISNFRALYIFAIQIFIMIFAGVEIIKIVGKFLTLKLRPSSLFIFSFGLLIGGGTILLNLPEMSAAGQTTSLMEALFTSVSAACVTGLSVIDVGSQFSFKGHLVLLMLMQLGGIGIITFAAFFTLFLSKGAGISEQVQMGDLLSSETLSSTKLILARIVFYTLFIELGGAVVIYGLWSPDPDFIVNQDLGTKLFYSIFHSVSAFCNAGFSLFPDSLMHGYIMDEPIMQLAFAVLIILGGLGFPVLRDLFSRPSLRQRMRLPWKKWKPGTTISIYSSAALIVVGGVLFFFLETGNTLDGMSKSEKIITSIFQSVTTRTAGFNSVDIGSLAMPTLLLFLFLMFIGGGSGSTAGGIKTSTFVVIILSVWTTIRGKKNVEIAHRKITFERLTQAFSIFAFAIIFIFIFSFLLSISDPQFAIIDIIFEQVSAFATVGLTRGITPDLSTTGQFLIICSMFVGRIGTLTLAFALSRPAEKTNYSYPQTKFMVG